MNGGDLGMPSECRTVFHDPSDALYHSLENGGDRVFNIQARSQCDDQPTTERWSTYLLTNFVMGVLLKYAEKLCYHRV